MNNEYDICYYCGKLITDIYDNNNADNWDDPETIGKRCCGKCNDEIVIPHRIISMYRGKNDN